MLWGILILVVGLSVGSFINVLLYRLPREENFTNSRSRCPSCYYQLRWFDLIPLASFVMLGGTCRNCKQKISFSYPLVEFIAGALSLSIYFAFFADPWHMFFWLIVVNLFFTLFLFDLQYFVLPDLILAWLGIFVVGFNFIYWFLNKSWLLASWPSSLLGAAIIVLFLGSIWFFSKGRWMGFGDVKLGLVLGLTFGLYSGIFILYFAVIIGGLISFILLFSKKATLKTKLPLGSFIAIAAIVYIFLQEPINIFINRLIL